MKISVVIPALNEASLLPLTLQSVRALTRQPDELIVVDNGSTDETASIARSYGATIISVSTRGIGLVRQKGLEKATGDIVAYTDADTLVPADWLTNIEKALTTTDVVGVFGTYKIHEGHWFFKLHMNHLQDPLARVLYLLRFPMVPGANFAVLRRQALAAGGFPTHFMMLEENEMARRLMSKGKVIYRRDIVVITSGRRGKEGLGIVARYMRALFLYIFLKRGDLVSFKDIRDNETI